MRPIRIVAPIESPISVDEAKENTRIYFDDDDDLVQRKINAAVDDLDGYGGILGRCICTQTWRVPFSGFSAIMRMPFCDVSGAVVKYLDELGVEQTVSGSDYHVIEGHKGAYLHFTNFVAPALNAGHPQPVWVEATAGYGGTADVPSNVKEAIFRLVDHWYENSSDGGDNKTMPLGFDHIIAKTRRVPV